MNNNNIPSDVTKLGVNVPSIQEQYKRASDQLKELLPNGTSPDEGIAGQMLNAQAQSSFQQNAQVQNIITNALDLNTSIGVQVDNLLVPLGLFRKPATRTYVVIKVTGVVGTLIPANTKILNTENNFLYFNKYDITIVDASNTAGIFFCDTTGPIPCAANSKWAFTQFIRGWSTINNLQSGVLGKPQESDFLYKGRAVDFRGSQSRRGSFEYIKKILSTNENVENYCLRSNPYPDDSLFVDGFEIPPGNFLISVAMKDPDIEQNWSNLTIAIGGDRTTFRMVSPEYYHGVKVRKLVVFKDTQQDNQVFISNFIKPINKLVWIKVLYTKYASTPPDIVLRVKQAIYDNFYGQYGPDSNIPPPSPSRCFIGDNITVDRFIATLQALNILGIIPPTLSVDGVIYSKEPIDITIFDNPVLLIENITVEEAK